MSGAESDSEEEGGLGNITRVVVRPPGHSGKAKRGHLSFDASFEGGNLGRVDFISEYEYDLFIRPDTCNPRYRFWFNFVVDNVRSDQRVIFNIVNFSKTKSLYRNGMTPMVRTSSRPKWQRLSEKYVYYHKSPEHRSHYILSFAFVFDREDDVFQFATCFPYTYSREEAHLGALLKRQLPFIRHQTLALSLQNRGLNLLTIGTGLPSAKKNKLVLIMGRTHPGETPTSFVVQGLIDFLTSSHMVASTIREHCLVQVLPMVNPDGVFMGNYRSSLMGYDLNRVWNAISPWAHPTLHALKAHLLQLASSKVVDMDIVIDVHAHSALLGAFVYGNSYDDVYRFERHILFPKLLAHNACDFNSVQTMYNRDPNKAGTARRHLCDILPSSVNVYTLQVSLFGYQQQKTGLLIPYTEEAYYRLGRNVARTIFDYYKATGLISQNIVAPPETISQPLIKRKSKKGRNSQLSSRSLHLTPLEQQEGGSSTSSSDLDSDSSRDKPPLARIREGEGMGEEGAGKDSSTPAPSSAASPSSLLSSGPGKKETLKVGGAPLDKESLRFGKQAAKPLLLLPTKCKTFDFSSLSEGSRRGGGGQQQGQKRERRERMERRREQRLFARQLAQRNRASRLRKIGGGGIITRAKGRRRGTGGQLEGSLSNSPFLTIIDLSAMMRSSLHAGRDGDEEFGEKLKRQGRLDRRRRAVAFRDYLTDVSPWEEEEEEEESDGSPTTGERRLEGRDGSDSDGYYSAPPTTHVYNSHHPSLA